MGRAKKSRKIRSANRRQKRIEKLSQRYLELVSDLRARRAERLVIEASDMPEELKRPLMLFVDPVGAVGEMVAQTAGSKPGEKG